MSDGGAVRLWGLWLACCLSLLPGCTYIRVAQELGRISERGPALKVDGYKIAAPRQKEHVAVGVAAEDITPPPGFPTGGHGSEGGLPRGHWMRLRARAFFFEDREGRALVLVSCDLFALPGGLHAQVAERVSAEAARRGVSLPPGSLILAATHTHHGPGNYMTSRVYNQFGASYSGFSKPLFDFLVERISNAVLGAIDDARRHPQGVELSVHVHDVGYDLVRNRSPHAFMANRNRQALLDTLNPGAAPSACEPKEGEPPTPTSGWDEELCPRLRAADRTLTVVDLHRVDGERRDHVGALVFFAVHPTVLAQRAPLYNPDFVGYAMQTLEREWTTAQGQPLVGFFNGAEGDITARRNKEVRDLRAIREFGGLLAAAIKAALDRPAVATEREPALAVRARLVRADEPKETMCQDSRQRQWKLSERPVIGAATLGGGEDDYTVLHQIGWSEGAVDRPVNGQGMKLPALDSRLVRAFRFTDTFAPPEIFPRAIPLTLASLGGLTLVTLPGEVTTAQGQAIREALGQQPHGKLELVGLANEYISYCSSPDEYSVQDYMGASTIWGPEEGPFIACRLSELAASDVPPVPPKADRRVFWPGPTPEEAFGPAFTGDSILRPDDGLHEVLLDENAFPERRLPWFAWDGPTGMCGKKPCPKAERRVVIWERTQDGWHPLEVPGQGMEDDLGANFLTVLLEKQGRWAAIWLRPLFQPQPGTFAFVAYPAGLPPSCSKPFTLGAGLMAPDATEIGTGTCDARGAPTGSVAATGPAP